MKSYHYEVKVETKKMEFMHVRALNKKEARMFAKRMMSKDIELYNGKIKEVRRTR